jgi:hypothetical protein
MGELELKKPECGFVADTAAYRILLEDSVEIAVMMMLQTVDIAAGGFTQEMLDRVRGKIIQDFEGYGCSGIELTVDDVIKTYRDKDDKGAIRIRGFIWEQ